MDIIKMLVQSKQTDMKNSHALISLEILNYQS